MDIIELEKWEPSEADPRKLKYAGQPLAQEVFAELRHRLDGMGCLPDEYFLLDSYWRDGREIPKDADIFCTTDYGGSEGIYLDIYLKWYEDGRPITKSFIIGKILGESNNDLDRMFLTASAVTKAFHGDRATHDRYMLADGVEEDTGGRVVHLSRQEEQVIIEALVEQRERQETAMSRTEQLLRRMTGSITAYMDTVGQRPLRLSDYDRTVLAIRDGELSAFRELSPKVLGQADSLLIQAAGRPGAVGQKMTAMLLEDVEQFSETAYRTACQKAIDTDAPAKVSLLLEQAADHVPELPLSFYGEMASYAHTEHRYIAKEIIRQCSEAQIAAAPSRLLEQFAADKDFRTLSTLVEKGISGGAGAARTLHMLTYGGRDSWMAEFLLEKRMWVALDDYAALHACIENNAVEVAELLLNGGMDFDAYQQWAQDRPRAGHEDTLQALTDYWSELGQAPAQGAGGMTFG